MTAQEELLEKQLKLFKALIQKRRVMIVDPEAFSRAALARVLIDLGASQQNITLVSNFTEAQAAVQAVCPDILLSEFDLDGGNCGVDLLGTIRKTHTGTGKAIFILVTGNSSQAAVARAAEEDVDGYLLKPYTADGIRIALTRYAVEKIHPTDYQKKIQDGKQRLADRQIDEALKLFEEATQLDSKPSLACFYHGFSENLKETAKAAESDFGKGLSFNHIHYKCMMGLFDLYVSQQRHKEAYEIAQKLAKYFPASPERLVAVLKLAVANEAFEDIERYYRLFCKLDQRNEVLVRHVSAALVVCGRYFLQQQKHQRALELFEKAKATAARNPRFLREIALALLGADRAEEARPFVEAYPPEAQATSEYKTLRYAVTECRLELGTSVAEGRKLLEDGVREPILYSILIERSVEAGYHGHAEKLTFDACRLWPDRAQEFQRALQPKAQRVAAS